MVTLSGSVRVYRKHIGVRKSKGVGECPERSPSPEYPESFSDPQREPLLLDSVSAVLLEASRVAVLLLSSAFLLDARGSRPLRQACSRGILRPAGEPNTPLSNISLEYVLKCIGLWYFKKATLIKIERPWFQVAEKNKNSSLNIFTC